MGRGHLRSHANAERPTYFTLEQMVQTDDRVSAAVTVWTAAHFR